MPLILAIEPDKRQAAQLSAVAKRRLDVELILVDTTQRALEAIGNRMPDLVLVPALLSPQDDAALAAALRVIAAAAHVQMLTIPVLGSARPEKKVGGVLSALRRGKSKAPETVGCDPSVFAEQIASYLERAGEQRLAAAAEDVDDLDERQEDAPSVPNQSVESTDGTTLAEFGDESFESDVPVLVRPDPHGSLPDEESVAEMIPPEGTPDQAVPAPITFTVPQTVVQPSILAVEPAEQGPATLEESTFSDADVPPGLAASEIHPEIAEKPGASVSDEGVSLALEEAVRALFAASEETASPTLDVLAQAADRLEVPEIDVPGEVEAETAVLTGEAVSPEVPDVAYTVVADSAEPQGMHLEPVVVLPAEPPDIELVNASDIEGLQTEPPERETEERAAENSGAEERGAEDKDEWEALHNLIAALDAMPLAALEATSPDEWIAPVVSNEPEPVVQKVEAVAPKPEPEVQPAPAPTATRSEREWVALIESLRHDVERLRNERAEKPAKKATANRAAKAEAVRAEKEKEKEKKTKPIQDEWGFFDPEQCGFAALLSKLDEVTDPEDQQAPAPDPHRRTR